MANRDDIGPVSRDLKLVRLFQSHVTSSIAKLERSKDECTFIDRYDHSLADGDAPTTDNFNLDNLAKPSLVCSTMSESLESFISAKFTALALSIPEDDVSPADHFEMDLVQARLRFDTQRHLLWTGRIYR